MIQIENVDIFGWEAAIRGARNPMNSWEKSDSLFFDYNVEGTTYYHDLQKHTHDDTDLIFDSIEELMAIEGRDCVMANDHNLLMNLCKGGSEEAKWRRMVHVQMDITAPLYWWKEFETYKVGTVSNSCSTMHKIHSKEFSLEDFSCENLFTDRIKDAELDEYLERVGDNYHIFDEEDYIVEELGAYECYTDFMDGYDRRVENYAIDALKITIAALNHYREKFLETKDKKYWWQMIQLLPSSYNQRRTIDLNYEVLAKQYLERKDHKLDEWRQYCEWIRSLPYSEFITLEEAK